MAANKRKAISKRTRFEVFKRDEFICQYCGQHPPKVILHVDHIVPVAEGGQNDEDNLVTACDVCNLGKGAKPLTDIPMSLAEKSARVKEREDQIRGYGEVMAARRERIEDECWQVAQVFIDQFQPADRSIRKDHFQSIKRFVELLGVHEVLDSMELATSKRPGYDNACFKYFCGICWRKIKGD